MMDDWKVALITIGSILGGILVSGIISELYLRVNAAKFNVKGKHCYVTGGSQGLGKSIAEDLARQGAHVTIVARREAVLKEALEEIKKHAGDKDQKFAYVCADVASKDDVERAVGEAVKKQGKEIEYAFLSAGVSNPGFFVEQSADVLEQTMKVNYFGTLFNAHAIARRMVKEKIAGGHIVMVSSTLGMFGLIGYAGYCGSKFAVRGLAEALRVELQMHKINVHCYFPGTIFTPGYETENLTKPKITKDIEGADDGLTPEQCARGMFKGLRRGECAITTDPISLLFRCNTRGAMPTNNYVIDTVVAAIGWVAFPPWRWYVDYMVKSFRHEKPKVE